MMIKHRWVELGVAVLSGLLLFAGCGDGGEGSQQGGAPQSGGSWQQVASWSGNGIQETENFDIASPEWRIRWSSANERVSGLLLVYVYDEGGELLGVPVNHPGVGSGEALVQQGPGRFRLLINAANVDWNVAVEDKR
jgi:hypothetical protein